MELSEVQQYLTDNKDTEEVKSYIGGLNPMTVDRTNEFLNTEDGKKLLQPKLDTYMNKGVESWKTNNFDKLYTDRFNKENPTADPLEVAKNKKMSDLEATITKMQTDSVRDKLTTKALKTLQSKNLPTELSDLLIGKDETSTNENIDKMVAMLTKHDEDLKKNLVGSNTYTPPKNDGKDETDEEKLRKQVRESMGMKDKKK